MMHVKSWAANEKQQTATAINLNTHQHSHTSNTESQLFTLETNDDVNYICNEDD